MSRHTIVSDPLLHDDADGWRVSALIDGRRLQTAPIKSGYVGAHSLCEGLKHGGTILTSGLSKWTERRA